MKIRKATKDDVTAIHALVSRYASKGKLLDRTPEEIATEIGSFFVATDEAGTVGCASLDVYSKKLAEIRSLAVSPEARGQGVGSKLVQACVAEAKARGVLEVMAITSEEKFFNSNGFGYSLPSQRKALFYQTR